MKDTANPHAEISRSRLLFFRMAAVIVVPLVFVLLVELGLRAAGFGYPTGFFLRREINGRACWVENSQFARRFFPRAAMRTPGSIAIPIQKGTNTIRIFVFGESAALGDPVPRFGFSRMVERLLQARFPEKRFEVVNVAMTAINSHVIRPIARDCAERHGDLWVIYMGNNEVVGPFGPGTVLGTELISEGIIRGNLAVKRTRVGQLLDSMLERLRSANKPAYWKGMELMAERKVRRDDPRMASVYRNFERNLEEILRAGTQRKTPVVLCTVGVNQRDCPPFASLPSDQSRADAQAAVALDANGKKTDAAAQYAAILKRDPAFAELHFRLAENLLAQQNISGARDHFRHAVDEDALRFRADSRINAIIRDAASRWQKRHVALLDIEQELAQRAPNGLPGDELFYEHVHLTPKGNYVLAKAAAQSAARALSLDGDTAQPNDSRRSWLTQAECEEQLGYTAWNRSQALRVILDRMQFAPFLGTFDHTNRLRKLRVDLDALTATNTPPGFQLQAAHVRKAVAAHPDDWELRENLGLLLSFAHDMNGAAEQLREAVRLMPHAASAHFSLAGVLALQKKSDEAMRHYLECLRLEPNNFHARMRMGIVELERRRFDDAIIHLRAAIHAKPDSVAARMYLGGALLQQQKRDEARQQFREVLRLEPNNAEARKLLESNP